jgi:hypothetical protein
LFPIIVSNAAVRCGFLRSLATKLAASIGPLLLRAAFPTLTVSQYSTRYGQRPTASGLAQQ